MHDISWGRQVERKNNFLIRTTRLVLVVLHLLTGVVKAGLLFPLISPARRRVVIRNWALRVLSILRIELVVKGAVPRIGERGVLFVANHVSWVDIYVLDAVCPVRFVSKAEVRSWPIIGWLAVKVGTFFIERTRRHDTGRINRALHDALDRGDCIAVFPEGTTSNGSLLRPFHASLLQAAVNSNARLWPAAIRYRNPDGGLNIAPAYADKMSFAQSLFRILAEPRVIAEVAYLEPLQVENRSRRELAALAERAIASALSLPIPCRKPGKSADPQAAPPTGVLPTGSPCPAQSDCCEPPAPVPTSAQK